MPESNAKVGTQQESLLEKVINHNEQSNGFKPSFKHVVVTLTFDDYCFMSFTFLLQQRK